MVHKTEYTSYMENITLHKNEQISAEKNAIAAAQIASDHIARDVLLLDVHEVSSYTDYLLIVTGESERHLSFLADHIMRELRNNGLHIDHREGDRGSGWVLLDFGSIVVHLFTETQRQHYNLEELWGAGREVLHMD